MKFFIVESQLANHHDFQRSRQSVKTRTQSARRCCSSWSAFSKPTQAPRSAGSEATRPFSSQRHATKWNAKRPAVTNTRSRSRFARQRKKTAANIAATPSILLANRTPTLRLTSQVICPLSFAISRDITLSGRCNLDVIDINYFVFSVVSSSLLGDGLFLSPL
jgi:hypothetical protein